MKILLDTNIIIHREANRVSIPAIGQLFYWIDKLHYTKYIHPITIQELNKFRDAQAVDVMNIKIESYNKIKNIASISDVVQKISQKIDSNENDINDTQILNEVYEGRIDILISEDKKIHTKASLLNIQDRVYKIQGFLEKVISENPELVDYKVLAVQKTDFAKVNINDSFFDSLRADYREFDKWFNKKADEPCYVCYDKNILTAFLYVKVEAEDENYSDFIPILKRKKRLKIGTLKVSGNGYKIGERFLKIIFDNAIQYKVEEIYVTVFNRTPEQEQLIEMLEEWGFIYHGIRESSNEKELVYTRAFNKMLPVKVECPKLTYPFFSRDTDKYIIKIEPQYHTELFPDSINTREDASLYVDNEPHRNRIGKIYISHSKDRNLKTGDIILIYRIGETLPKIYSSTLTTICIVENVIEKFDSFECFYQACNRRTVIKKNDLEKNWWNKYPSYRPFVINFLYAFSFKTPKPTLHDLNCLGVIPDIKNMPKGFIKITNEQFNKIVNFAYRKK